MLVLEQQFCERYSSTAESKAYTSEGKKQSEKLGRGGGGEGEEIPGFHFSTLALHSGTKWKLINYEPCIFTPLQRSVAT